MSEDSRKWIIGEKHPVYGEVGAMGVLNGEPYRWFVKDNLVSMIPLSMLEDQEDE